MNSTEKMQAIQNKAREDWLDPGIELDRYYSVEFTTSGGNSLYQFKLWNMAPKDVCILVKEDSQILPQLRKGDTLNMKYYLDEEPCSVESHKTAIRNVTKDDQGRFKGHYVVQLEILDH